MFSYLRKPSPDGCFAGNGRYRVVRVFQILSQSFQAFRDVFLRELFSLRIPRIRSNSLPVFAFAPFTSALNIVILFRKQKKNARKNISSLSSSSGTGETRVRGPIARVTMISRGVHFLKMNRWRIGVLPHDTQTHTETHIIIMQIFVNT